MFEVGSPTPLATYTFSLVFVTSDQVGSSVNQLNESVSLAFGKIESSIILNGTTFNSCFDIQSNSNC